MTPEVVMLLLGLVLFIKHYVADGPLQTSYQYKNKGKFLHPGGLLHAGIHAGMTFVVLIAFSSFYLYTSIVIILQLVMLEYLIHYFCDFTKVCMGANKGWSDFGKDDQGRDCLRIRSNDYFLAMIIDQCVHFATYLIIAYAFVTWG